MALPDALRLITISLGAIMIILALCVVVLYDYTVRVTNRAGTRFLPTHIATIGAAFIIFSGAGIAEMIGRLGKESVTWRLPVLLISFGLANIAMATMLNVIRAQLKEAPR